MITGKNTIHVALGLMLAVAAVSCGTANTGSDSSDGSGGAGSAPTYCFDSGGHPYSPGGTWCNGGQLQECESSGQWTNLRTNCH